MTKKQLTIAQRILIGFASLTALNIALGIFASYMMRDSTAGARFLSDAVVPQSDVAEALSTASTQTRFAVRDYARTGDPSTYTHVVSLLEGSDSILARAQALARSQPELTGLVEGLPKAAAALADYRSEVEQTKLQRERHAAAEADLDRAAAQFTESSTTFLADQNRQFAAEIAAGSTAANLEARRLRVAMAETIRSEGDAIRLARFRSQATGDLGSLEAAFPRFREIDETITQLTNNSRGTENLRLLRAARESSLAYRKGIESIIALARESSAIDQRRNAAGDRFDSIVNGLLNSSNERTLAFSQTSATSLGFASNAIIVGLALATTLSLGIGYFITRSINRKLTQTAESLALGATQVASASTQVSSSSQSLATGAAEQAASLEEVSSSVEELSASTRQNSANADSCSAASAEAREAAENGAAEMQRMHVAMDAIQKSSTAISNIIKTIDEIAFQTNILALNAAVEAARAGDAGAGFAVVAEEVRSLAQRSAVAARETTDKIADALNRSAQGVEISGRVTNGFETILEMTRKVDTLVAALAHSAREQNEGLSQINGAISNMDSVTQSAAANAEETASAAEELNAQSQELRSAAAELAALVGVDARTASSHSATTKAARRPAESDFVSFETSDDDAFEIPPRARSGASRNHSVPSSHARF